MEGEVWYVIPAQPVTMPLDIDGVEALISENTKANIDDLKERFNA